MFNIYFSSNYGEIWYPIYRKVDQFLSNDLQQIGNCRLLITWKKTARMIFFAISWVWQSTKLLLYACWVNLPLRKSHAAKKIIIRFAKTNLKWEWNSKVFQCFILVRTVLELCRKSELSEWFCKTLYRNCYALDKSMVSLINGFIEENFAESVSRKIELEFLRKMSFERRERKIY